MKAQLLFIEDNNMTGEFLTKMFDREYNIKWCKNGVEAIEWIRDFNIPNLIVTDYEMPDMNGLDFLTEIKRTGFMKDIPVVMLSGKAPEEVRKEVLAAGAADFLMKPFKPKELRSRLEELLYRHKYFAPRMLI